MSFIKNYRKNAECTRMMNATVLKAAAQNLKHEGGDEKLREDLADHMCDLLDTNMEQESKNSKVEYSAGRLTGIILGGAAAIGGVILGKVASEAVKHFINK